jgi:hypothetical protein
VLISNKNLDTKLESNHHKLAIKYRIKMINAQVDSDAEILDFLNIEEILTFV